MYYISGSTIPSSLANSVHVLKMCNALANAGHHVTLFAKQGDDVDNVYAHYGVQSDFEIEYVNVPAVPGVGGVLYSAGVRRKLKRLNEQKPDLLYSRHIYALASVASTGVPMVYEAHALPESKLRWHVEEWVFRRRNFARLIVISEALKRDYADRHGPLLNGRISVAHDAADLPSAHNDVAPAVTLDGLPGRRIGYVGHLYRGKGMELIGEVARHLPQMTFHIVGGTESDVALWRERLAEVRNVRFHGHVPHAHLGQYYEQLDIVLAPLQDQVLIRDGRTDIAKWTSPLKIFEYMAYSKAMIVSDIPVLREVVDTEVAVLAAPNRVADWVQAITSLVADPEYGKRLGTAAFQRVLARHTWDGRADRIVREIGI